MLRRINSALFEAPEGVRIQVVAEAQGNNGVNDARFEYAQRILPRETVLGLPGCSFIVEGFSERLEAVVIFDPSAPGTARYDLFEVENGVKNDLHKSTKSSESAPLISFTIDPVLDAVSAPTRGLPRRAAGKKDALKRKATRKAAKKTPARKRAPSKRRIPAKKKTAANNTAGSRRASPKRKTSRKRGK